MMTDAIVTVATTGLDAKREAARAYLGTKWLGHRDYVPSARHSTNPEIYQLSRQDYLVSVANEAARCRLSNPAFQRAASFRKLVG